MTFGRVSGITHALESDRLHIKKSRETFYNLLSYVMSDSMLFQV